MTFHPLSFAGLYRGVKCCEPGAIIGMAHDAITRLDGVSAMVTRPLAGGMDVVFFNGNAKSTKPDDPLVKMAQDRFTALVEDYNGRHGDQITLGPMQAKPPERKNLKGRGFMTLEEAQAFAAAQIRKRTLTEEMLELLHPDLRQAAVDGSILKVRI